MQLLIVGDQGSVLDRIENRIGIFWPPEIPLKTTAVYCGWAQEVIETVGDYRPDILLLNCVFRHDIETGKDVALWIDRNYRRPILVAAHSDRPEADMREFFRGTECVKYFISGDSIRDFVEYCTQSASSQ